MRTLRFALATTPQSGESAVVEIRKIFHLADIDIEPVFVPNYGALYEAMLADADVAWCPPLVARDLLRERAADACVCVVRGGSVQYFSAIVGTEKLHSPKDIERFGWVSRLSAAGYLVPRSYLASVGVTTFREERFFHSHQRSMSALQAGVVDAIATYAYRDGSVGHESTEQRVPHAFEGARVLATIGPIPGDVIVLARSVAPEIAKRITGLLQAVRIDEGGAIATLMGATSFGAVPPGHVESVSRWIAQPVFSRTQNATTQPTT